MKLFDIIMDMAARRDFRMSEIAAEAEALGMTFTSEQIRDSVLKGVQRGRLSLITRGSQGRGKHHTENTYGLPRTAWHRPVNSVFELGYRANVEHGLGATA